MSAQVSASLAQVDAILLDVLAHALPNVGLVALGAIVDDDLIDALQDFVLVHGELSSSTRVDYAKRND